MMVWSLAVVSVVCGVATAWVFRRFTDRAALRQVRRHLYAHLLELRLFSDEPALIWKAQKALFRDNLRLLALVLRPALILTLPFALLFIELDAVYSWGPLAMGQSAVVTVQMSRPLEDGDARDALDAPPELTVETPPVRSFADRQISWRIRAVAPVRGSLRLAIAGHVLTRSISVGERLPFDRRREHVFFVPGVTWTEVGYPPASVKIAGLSLPWVAWFLLISAGGAAASTIWLGAPL
jgi:hypothetical protein